MRSLTIALLAVAIALPCLVTASVAAPLDGSIISADAKWVGHMNVDAIKESEVVKKVYAAVMEKHPEAAKKFEEAKAKIGMDPRKDLHGITCYGMEVGKKTGVMIVTADVDADVLLALAEKAKDHKTIDYKGNTIHTWTHKPHGKVETGVGAIVEGRVVFASSVDLIKTALDVIAGKAKCLPEDSVLARQFPKGASVIFRVTGLQEADLPTKSPLADKVKYVGFAMGERDGKSYAGTRITMVDTESAEKLKTMATSGLNIAKIHAGEKSEKCAKMLEGVKIFGREANVMIIWSAPVEDVLEALKAAHEMHMKKKCGEKKGCPKKPCEK